MSTHSIGQGRELLAASVPTELKRAFGRLAFLSDKSMALMVRELVEQAVEQAKKDGRLLAVFAMLFLLSPQLFRAPSLDDGMVRNVRKVRGKRKDDLDTLFDEGGEV